MLFNSLQFLVFFVVVTTAYFALPVKHRWWLLLTASCYFYMVFVPVYILILAFTIVIDYFAGLLIAGSRGRARRLYLLASLVANIGVLAIFKYYNFLNDNLTALLGTWAVQNPFPALTILLPIGLSFHTFQAMSYTIEVYRGDQEAERHFGIYALYVMFYPQLVAGPIERPQNLLHQFRERFPFDYRRIADGLRLMGWGLLKKAVVADRLAQVVDEAYRNPGAHPGSGLFVATVFFAFQIYCDFSAYSDMARGAARVMGFHLMRNFDVPYLATNIQEFWRRWHISLSTWFRDYLYFPLGGSRGPLLRVCLNLFIVFTVSGLWHGANWTYVIWGALHGAYLIVFLLGRRAVSSLPFRIPAPAGLVKVVGFGLTFFAVITAWVFFRANHVSDAFYIVTHMYSGLWESIGNVLQGQHPRLGLDIDRAGLLLSGFLIVALLALEGLNRRFQLGRRVAEAPFAVRWLLYYALVLTIIFMGVFEQRQFIYFQF
jgi:D-alanyl-lipoteichoic acid acyltransferase DltB (MBOAT superfamily)